MDQSLNTRQLNLRNIISTILMAIGLGLFMFLGSKALSQLGDRRFVEGRPNQQVYTANTDMNSGLYSAVLVQAAPLKMATYDSSTTNKSASDKKVHANIEHQTDTEIQTITTSTESKTSKPEKSVKN